MNIHKVKGDAGARQRGVGLIEVLIALLVISIGILAVLGMQITGKKANYDAVQRTTATHLAWDLMERVRANRSAAASYVVALASPIGDGSLAAAACTLGSPCTPAELAEADLYEWEQTLLGASEESAGGAATGGLVEPRACVEDMGDGEYLLTIAWRGTQELKDASPAVTSCGEGLAGDPYGADEEYRRFITVSFFVQS
jgi:type IV pilus assembly protein PilV